MTDKPQTFRIEDVQAVTTKIAKMCDRVTLANKFQPGAYGKMRLIVDGVAYDVYVTLAPK